MSNDDYYEEKLIRVWGWGLARGESILWMTLGSLYDLPMSLALFHPHLMKEKPETTEIKLLAQSPTAAMGQSSDSSTGGSGSSSMLLTLWSSPGRRSGLVRSGKSKARRMPGPFYQFLIVTEEKVESQREARAMPVQMQGSCLWGTWSSR